LQAEQWHRICLELFGMIEFRPLDYQWGLV